MTPKRLLLENDEQAIREALRNLSDLTHAAIRGAVDAMARGDMNKARQVVDGDAEINELNAAIEAACFSTIATQQPVASDLRAILAAGHITWELERIADHAVAIAKITIDSVPTGLPPDADIQSMTSNASQMLKRAIEAYLKGDAEAARALADLDNEVDKLQTQLDRRILQGMSDNAHEIETGTHLLWIGHNLERIADRALNIAERVIFMVEGEIVELND